MFSRISVVVLALLAFMWMALIFDIGGIVSHLGDFLNHLDSY
ncbi:hypothetical protein ACKURH_10870 [Enterobacter soli]|nr:MULTISPECIES: hypothetical protein [Enterobacter]MDR7942351.1 hypothetical protein [Enterobacter soli]